MAKLGSAFRGEVTSLEHILHSIHQAAIVLKVHKPYFVLYGSVAEQILIVYGKVRHTPLILATRFR